jgi:hypothetical protein
MALQGPFDDGRRRLAANALAPRARVQAVEDSRLRLSVHPWRRLGGSRRRSQAVGDQYEPHHEDFHGLRYTRVIAAELIVWAAAYSPVIRLA